MQVLMFGWELPPFNSGGLGVACFGLARALAKKLDLTFVLPHRVGITSPSFKVLFADLAGLDPLITPYSSHSSDLLSQVYQYSLAAQKLAKQLHFDITPARVCRPIPAGLAAKAASGKPLVIHVHATEFDRAGGSSINPTVYSIEKSGFDQADLVITISDYVKNTLVSRYVVPENKIKVVHNGIDASDYLETSGPVAFIQQVKAQGGKVDFSME